MGIIRKALCLTVCSAFLLAGCSQQEGAQNQAKPETAVEGLSELGKIKVVSREEGSGTRGTFAELLDFAETDDGRGDATTEDAQIENDTAAVIVAVEEDSSAIGYVSAGALDGTEKVKVLTVGGISPGKDDRRYALGRSFYLAWSGKLSDAEQEFLTYVHGAGQELVAQSYTPVAKSGSFFSMKEKGSIKVGGSTSVAPLLQELADSYQKQNPNVNITVEQTDSTDGLTKAMSGAYDLGMSSRDLKDYELELLDYETIARDDIAVIVSADNPLTDISCEMLKSIYTGEMTEWGK